MRVGGTALASGALASGALASGALASGALASGALASGARGLALGAAILLGPLPARADSVDLPRACPPGSHGRTAHEGQWCAVADCESGCEEGESCTTWRVCTQIASVVPGGLRPVEPPPEPRELVVASCEPASSCTGLEEPPPPFVGTLPTTAPTCAVRRVCVPATLPDLPPAPVPSPMAPPATGDLSASSCACHVGASSSATRLGWLAGLAWLGAWRARRRSRR